MIDTTNMSIMANFVQATSSTMASHMISKKDSDSDSNLSINELGVNSDTFSSYDTDANALLSQSELTTAIDTAMSQFDGEMPSKEEFQAILADFGFEPGNDSSNSNLSSSQLETISSTLENYDSDNLSKSDAQAIVAAFQEAGINPSSDLETAMEEAGFSAQEVGTLAGVGPQGGAPQGGGAGAATSSAEEETYDAMDTNQDGVVSLDELEEYYGINTDNSSQELSTSQQNSLDNLQLLMRTLKSSDETGSISTNSFDGLLKAINNQNNNSEINTYLQNTNVSSLFNYA